MSRVFSFKFFVFKILNYFPLRTKIAVNQRIFKIFSTSSSIGIYWREISRDFVSSWDFTTPLPPKENFSPSSGISKIVRVSPHFFSSRGIPQDEENSPRDGGGGGGCSQTCPKCLKDHTPPTSREHLLISWDPTRWGEIGRSFHHFENCRPYPTPSMKTSPHLVGNSHHFENDKNPRRNLISIKYTVKIRSVNYLSLYSHRRWSSLST